MILSQTFLETFIISFKTTLKTFSIKLKVKTMKIKFLNKSLPKYYKMHYYTMLDMNINNPFYNYALDIMDTKIYKSKQITPKKTNKDIYIVQFQNKVLATTPLPKTFHHFDIIKTLPYNLQEQGKIPIVTHKLGNIIRNYILSYKRFVSSIYTEEEISSSLSTALCGSEKSTFCENKSLKSF